MSNVFYGAYVHCKPDGTPFYVGKTKNSRGSMQRCHDFTKRNQYHKNTVAKYGKENIIVEVMPCKTEAEAFFRERMAISALRASGVLLCNMTDGGDGSVGCRASESTRLKMSKSYTPRTPEMLSKFIAANVRSSRFSGRRHTEETKKKMSAWQVGKRLSEETKAKISAAQKRRIALKKASQK